VDFVKLAFVFNKQRTSRFFFKNRRQILLPLIKLRTCLDFGFRGKMKMRERNIAERYNLTKVFFYIAASNPAPHFP